MHRFFNVFSNKTKAPEIDLFDRLCDPLTSTFSDRLSAHPECSDHYGWGQFLGTPQQSIQVGQKGTCAGVVVLSLTDPATDINPNIITYLESLWRDQNHPKRARYFDQTFRVAFMCYATLTARSDILRGIGEELLLRLLEHRAGNRWAERVVNSTDGPVPTSRADATAWVLICLSLSEKRDDDIHRAINEALPSLEGAILKSDPDPLVLAALSLWHDKVKRPAILRAKTIDFLRRRPPSTDVYMYYSEYIENSTGKRLRDYICIPHFFLVTLIVQSGYQLSITRFGARRKLFDLFASICNNNPPLAQSPSSRFPSTMDQFFLIKSIHILLRQSLTGKNPLVNAIFTFFSWASKSFLTQMVLPIFIIFISVVIAKDPALLSAVTPNILYLPVVTAFIGTHKDAFQLLAIGVITFLSPVLIPSIIRWFKRFFIRDIY